MWNGGLTSPKVVLISLDFKRARRGTITRMWTHKTLPDASNLEERPPAVDPAEAQQWCNFVVCIPERVPAGCHLLNATLRREAPPGRLADAAIGRTPWSANNPSAYRFEVAGPGRRLRIKEFLYDWAFPALDHPCLWKSQTEAVPLDDRYVVWFGIDYLGNRAASARLARTTIELSVLEGEFANDEIVQLYRALRPADPAAATVLFDTPFAILSYWARRADAEMVSVPVGLWKFRRPGADHEIEWVTHPEARSLLDPLGLPSTLGDMGVDSVARFADKTGRTKTEVVYVAGPDRGHELRLIAQGSGPGGVAVPAEPEDHPGTHETLEIRGSGLQLAWIDDRFGPFDAVLHHPATGLDAKLLSSTGIGMDRTWFVNAVEELLP